MQVRKLLAVGMILFLLLGIGVTAALAATSPGANYLTDVADDEPIEFTGTVTAIDEDAGTIHVQVLEVSDYVVYTVHVPAGFDFGSVNLLDTVDVVGTLDENGEVWATEIVVHPGEGEPIEFTGTVTAFDEDAGTISVQVLEVSDYVVYLVHVPAGFDFGPVDLLDTVDVVGMLDANGEVWATEIFVHPGEGDPIEFTGTVTAIDEAAGTIHVQVLDVSDVIVYLVYVPEGFDFSLLELYDTVEVVGTLDANGDVIATSIVIVGEDEEGPKDNYFCQHPEAQHPVALAILNTYGDYDGDGDLDVTYEEIMAWFCGTAEHKGVGFGQIMLAFQTAAATEDTTDTFDMYLTMRAEQGWGKIWQELGLVGRPEDAGKPEDVGRPEDAGKPEEVGRPEDAGKPEWAGPPEGSGKPEDTGKPADTGKPEDTGKPADTGKPDNTGKPADTGKPENTGKPADTGQPAETGKPDKGGKP